MQQEVKPQGLRASGLAAIVTEEGGMPHNINLCGECYDNRLTEQRESNVSNADWKDMIKQKIRRGWLWAAFGADGFIKRMRQRLTSKKWWAKHWCTRGAAGGGGQ